MQWVYIWHTISHHRCMIQHTTMMPYTRNYKYKVSYTIYIYIYTLRITFYLYLVCPFVVFWYKNTTKGHTLCVLYTHCATELYYTSTVCTIVVLANNAILIYKSTVFIYISDIHPLTTDSVVEIYLSCT
jgi:hypothetical protein